MKILLDECLPIDFRHSFPGHDAHTVQWAGFKGKKNGELLRAAEAAGYDVFLTVDQGIPNRLHSGTRSLFIVVLHAPTNRIEDLLPLVPDISENLAPGQPGRIVHTSSSR